MGFKNFVNKVQKSAKDFQITQKEQMKANAIKRQEHQALIALQKKEAQEAEEFRIQQIVSGKIEPIAVSINLQNGENAYFSVPSNRMANVERVIELTTGSSKKKGVITRGIVGGVLLGPVGVIAGAATAKSNHTSRTVQQTVTKFESIDNGTLVLTNKRIIFIGNQILSLPYDQIIAYSFTGNKQTGYRFVPKYNEMFPNETFVVGGPTAHEIELYYRGITTNLIK